MPNKGQIAALDTILSAVIFIVLITTIFLVWNKYTNRLNETTRFNEIELKTIQLMDLMIRSPGVPDDWEKKTISGPYNSDANTKGLWHMDEGSGTTMTDNSGSGNTGTLLGINGPAPTWTTGVYQNALDFTGGVSTGKYQYVKIPVTSGSSLDIKGSLTLETWVKTTTTSATQSIIDRLYNYALWIQGNKINFMVYDLTGGMLIVQSTSTIQTNTWTQISGVYDHSAGKLSIYINGKLDATSNKKVNNWVSGNNYDLRIGNGYVSGSFASQLNGDIDEIRISNIARSNFTTSSVTVLGLAKEDKTISKEKIEALAQLNYTLAKQVMNIDRYDYYLVLKKENQSIIEIGNITNKRSVRLQRGVIYENEPAKIELAIW